MIVEILVAKRQSKDTLAQEAEQGMADIAGIPVIDKALGPAFHQSTAAIRFGQQQHAGVGDAASTVELGRDLTPIWTL